MPNAPDLARRAADPGWTPGLRDVPALLALLAAEDDDIARDGARAVLRIEARHTGAISEHVASAARAAERPARGRLTRLAGDLSRAREADASAIAPARAWLLEAVRDADPKTRRAAARGLGKLRPTDEVRAALAAAFDAFEADEDRKVIGEALGKVGGDAARARLDASPELVRARLVLDRDAARERPQEVALEARLGDASVRELRYHVRRGLEPVLVEELGGAAETIAPGVVRVRAEAARTLEAALAPRLALDLSLPLPEEPLQGGLAETVARALVRPATRTLFRTLTRGEGPARFRLAFRSGGHQRAVVWRIAELVQASAGEALVNAPSASTWEVVVETRDGAVRLEVVPRGFDDRRFAYRTRTVPASSHPTIAAALARVSPRRDDDVVWDPFTGAGAELVERARLGPYARLVGTDTDEGAVAAARANLEAAGVRGASVTRGDALHGAPAGVTAIVSNPPMGRRVQRGGHLPLLEAFVRHAADLLPQGGSLTWIVPEPREVMRTAERSGLVQERGLTVDMGGFAGELLVLRKRG